MIERIIVPFDEVSKLVTQDEILTKTTVGFTFGFKTKGGSFALTADKIVSDDIVRSIIKAELVRLHKGENYSITFETNGDAVCEKVIKQPKKETVDEKKKQLLLTKVTDMDLSVRALNCLKAMEVETLAQLVAWTKSDLLKCRQLGPRTADELEELVTSKGFTLGMKSQDLKKYGL